VTIVLVTDGNAQHQESIRYSEFKKATTILGVPETNLIFLGFSPMANWLWGSGIITSSTFKMQIDKYNPDIVLYPNPYDYKS